MKINPPFPPFKSVKAKQEPKKEPKINKKFLLLISSYCWFGSTF